MTSTVERAADHSVITGFEYAYNELNLITLEIDLAKDTEICYTYDELGRVVRRVKTNTETGESSTENYAYDAAGNLIQAKDNGSFFYDQNNRLIEFNSLELTYDADGNMISDGEKLYTYDSSNRLVYAGDNEYVYNVENTRIRNVCFGVETKYVYDVNSKLNKLLVKTTDGVTTKYVYGRGLIGEEDYNGFKTYHFDYRGSTVALTNIAGEVTDTFSYDTYGKCISHTGTSNVIFGYNGRDGVVTDTNGLIYMRARYYNVDYRRFVNADVIAGNISKAVTLNRYAYANGNPVSYVDPFGLSAEKSQEKDKIIKKIEQEFDKMVQYCSNAVAERVNHLNFGYKETFEFQFGAIKYYFSIASSCGDGEIGIEVSNAVNQQLEILASLSISAENVEVTFNSDSVSVSYSTDIGESSITIAASFSLDRSYSIEYSSSTKFGDTSSLDMTVGVEVKNDKDPSPKVVTEPSKSEERSTQPSTPNKPSGVPNGKGAIPIIIPIAAPSSRPMPTFSISSGGGKIDDIDLIENFAY